MWSKLVLNLMPHFVLDCIIKCAKIWCILSANTLVNLPHCFWQLFLSLLHSRYRQRRLLKLLSPNATIFQGPSCIICRIGPSCKVWDLLDTPQAPGLRHDHNLGATYSVTPGTCRKESELQESLLCPSKMFL